jgi:hypothetical protein
MTRLTMLVKAAEIVKAAEAMLKSFSPAKWA